jgi:hypothetical protein
MLGQHTEKFSVKDERGGKKEYGRLRFLLIDDLRDECDLSSTEPPEEV